MSTAEKWDLISEEDYLAGELVSEEKHEYLGGVVYAMAGASNRHNRIVVNILGALHGRLRGKSCDPYNSDTKVRIRLVTGTRYYYPDAMVVCESNPDDDSFQDRPVLIVEVLSETTRRADEWEKRDAYLSIASLNTYLLVEQDSAKVSVLRRTADGFTRENFAGVEQVIPIPDIGTNLPLGEIFEGIELGGA